MASLKARQTQGVVSVAFCSHCSFDFDDFERRANGHANHLLVCNACDVLLTEVSLEVELPTVWTDEKQRWEESEKRREEKGREEKRREEERRSKKRKSQKKEDIGARKGRKVAKHCVFPMICASGGSKSRLAKAAGAEPAGQMRGEKLHAVVARNAFPSQKC